MILVDSHAHIFDMKKDYVLPDGIIPVVVGYSHGSNRKVLDYVHQTLKRSHIAFNSSSDEYRVPFVLGIAPQTVLKESGGSEKQLDVKLDEWVDLIETGKPNAIGEVGLDYKWAKSISDVELQKKVFNRMIALAKRMKLPLVIHSRNNPSDNEVPKDAVEDIINMINGGKILMHFYSGTAEQAERIVKNGGYISISHLHSKERRKVIESVPLDRLLVESDSPYVGKTPEVVRDAAQYIADVKGLELEMVAKATTNNAQRFFNFKIIQSDCIRRKE